jgi:hypothetical protein
MWHGYFAIEDLNLSVNQRSTLIDELRTLGPASDPSPARLNHWRTRLDDTAAIFEAAFDEDNLTVIKFKQRLGNIFSVDPATINHTTQQIQFVNLDTPVVVFMHSGTDYLRLALFGGVGATREESRIEVLGYLAANRLEWEDLT